MPANSFAPRLLSAIRHPYGARRGVTAIVVISVALLIALAAAIVVEAGAAVLVAAQAEVEAMIAQATARAIGQMLLNQAIRQEAAYLAQQETLALMRRIVAEAVAEAA